MTRRDELLSAYDEYLRGTAEMAGCHTFDHAGPLLRGITDRGTGFVSYPDLAELTGADLDDLIARTVQYYRDDTDVSSFEWKTRGHDLPVDLGERLTAHGLEPEPTETVMVGEVDALAGEVGLPHGVVVRCAGDGGDLRSDLEAAAQVHREVFDFAYDTDHLIKQITEQTGNEVWLAEVDGVVVSAGRIVPVPGSPFAGIWGGATVEQWRGHGLYRALTAARARSAREHGARLINSDCSAMSQPILERAGLVSVTTTAPYVWHR